MQAGLHGGQLQPQGRAGLLARQALEVAQHQDLTVRALESRDGRVDGLHQLPTLERRLRIHFVQRRRLVGVGPLAQKATLAHERPQHAHAGVFDDSHQPKERPGAPRHVGAMGQLDERLLHGVVRVVAVTANP